MIIISIRVSLMPLPGATDDVVQVRISRFPIEFPPNSIAAGNQNGWVAGAARADFGRNGVTRDLAGCLEHLSHTVALAIAQVVNAATSVQRTQGQDVGLGQVNHMNVVTYAGAVVGRVIIAKDRHLVPLAQCHAE
jgi:hypothetical protein